MIVPIRPLGQGSFGHVYLTADVNYGIVASKIVQRETFSQREIDAAVDIGKQNNSNPFILKYIAHIYGGRYSILHMEVANKQTLNIIAKQPSIPLPSYTLRALMKQILEGMRAFHSIGLVHRDIKCDNILLHSPPGSGRVYAKISDFGLSKKLDLNNEQTYFAGTLPFMAPELFQRPIRQTQKVDMYAIGIILYRLVIHEYPLHYSRFEEYQMVLNDIPCIERPSEIKDNLLWDLLLKLLEFDPNKRITATEALQYPYFTSPEAIADISKEQQDLASQAEQAQLNGDSTITVFDKDPTFVVDENIINRFIPKTSHQNPFKQQKEIKLQEDSQRIQTELQTSEKQKCDDLIWLINDNEEVGKPSPMINQLDSDGTVTKLVQLFLNDRYITKVSGNIESKTDFDKPNPGSIILQVKLNVQLGRI
ncbi:MAG: putative Serine/Threonine kinase domain protein [Streblomastix strix]|uniref:Putative Serine/Threonine kinase domain protein n=1 Tax=Streblomastix strix TaxID=222440 RepID=A0A5J4VWY1_9EUKA|nr:MAG: putative Serine/Threonine kinase domain protein [Streblomastix strix]